MIDGQRRTASLCIFAAAYKKKILAEADAAAGSGQIGELLRREGIYSSTLTRWRRERDDAVDSAFAQKRGPEPKRNPLTAENEKLRRQNQRLQEELRKAEIIIDVPKKVAVLLGRPLPPVPDSENS
jgi:transposase